MFEGFYIHHYKEVVSTNIEALDLIDKKISNETAIIANKQTDGKGRTGKVWISPEGNLHWKEILEAIDSENKDNVIEKIQEKLKIEDAEEYYEWEKANFDTNHLFAIEHISHTIECGQFGFSSVCEKKEIHHQTLFILAVINGCTRIAEALIEKVVAEALGSVNQNFKQAI
ncbi:Hypothetical protein CINCED_3A017075 [Cinara cedri]|uniref:BPL/LPL catalytic domain-containing protein n=1 Tax=Cinara cedri TaxID=506608 RepID=A0A5E4MZP4_9HEMI|nr:Hypothetical protein CINCED_3A017075 [Cinara cedri]